MSSSSSDSDSSDDDKKRKKKREKKERKRKRKEEKKAKKKAKKARRSRDDDGDDAPASPPVPDPAPALLDAAEAREATDFKRFVQGSSAPAASRRRGTTARAARRALEGLGGGAVDYGGALRPGEGAAIAQYVQKNMRIPGAAGRLAGRGDRAPRERGLRHERQPPRAHERRAHPQGEPGLLRRGEARALITFEEKQQQENKVMGEFRAMLQQRLVSQGLAKAELGDAPQ
ncbi:hypothetical protein JL721_8561 [Aureococcus anophagefferens]|nr:hypothetical protein JL721_8561 [Aureococcus anophagefferens]